MLIVFTPNVGQHEEIHGGRWRVIVNQIQCYRTGCSFGCILAILDLNRVGKWATSDNIMHRIRSWLPTSIKLFAHALPSRKLWPPNIQAIRYSIIEASTKNFSSSFEGWTPAVFSTRIDNQMYELGWHSRLLDIQWYEKKLDPLWHRNMKARRIKTYFWSRRITDWGGNLNNSSINNLSMACCVVPGFSYNAFHMVHDPTKMLA